MCELDNLAYAIGLVESVRVRAEYAGRCHLNELQAAELWWSKAVFMFVVPVGLLVPMPIIALESQGLFIVALLPIPFVSRFLPVWCPFPHGYDSSCALDTGHNPFRGTHRRAAFPGEEAAGQPLAPLGQNRRLLGGRRDMLWRARYDHDLG